MTRKQALRDAGKARDYFDEMSKSLMNSSSSRHRYLSIWSSGLANTINWLMEREEERKAEEDKP